MRQSLWFTGVRQQEIRSEPLPTPGPGQLGVTTLLSAISAGTELLLYRGQMPAEMSADASIEALSGTLAFPLKYGYSAVGLVTSLGDRVDAAWLGQRVFAFNPHETGFVISAENAISISEHIESDAAVLLPNMETALSFAMDGAPIIGERVLVLGQGIVGLLTTHLLAQMPLASLTAVDKLAIRRNIALEIGATQTFGIDQPLESDSYDLVYELSGNPAALNTAIDAVAFGGRIVVGSWYGTKRASLDLGGAFHRKHVQIISSQVSTLAPRWQGRWTKARRMQTALQLLPGVNLNLLITQRTPFDSVLDAYRLLDTQPNSHLQTVLTYG